MEQVDLSVVVPVYNVENYLEACLDSILNQSFYVGEIICVDDGSTDKSFYILQKYAEKYSRIRIIRKENGGIVSARKAGVLAATGKYVTYVDADDWIEKNMYMEMMCLLKSEDADIVTSGCIRDYETHCIIENENVKPGIYYGDSLTNELLMKMIDTDSFFRSNISMHIYNKIYERNLLTKFQLKVDEFVNVAEDAACIYPCILNSKKVAVTGKAYYHYCMRTDSTMGTKKRDEFLRYQILFEGLYKEFALCQNRVSNIMVQFQNLKYYVLMLQCLDKIMKYNGTTLFPVGNIQKNDRIVVYGAGRFGVELVDWLKRNNFNVVNWVDKKTKANVNSIESLKEGNFDKIIIAVLLNDIVTQIKNELESQGFDKEIIYAVNCKMFE